MNKLANIAGKIGFAFSHPGQTLAALFESDTGAAIGVGFVSMSGWFLLFFASPTTADGMSKLSALGVGVLVFIFVTLGVMAAPTEDEHWGRAPKRLATKILHWVFGLIVVALIFIFCLFVYYAK